MEIVIETGKKSSVQKRRMRSPYDLLIFGMSIPKKELDARIESRTRHMFAGGWVEEVQALLKAGVSVDDPAMESVGYTAIARRLQAGKTSKVIKEDRELFSEINRRTRQYAKRQRTWWKKDLRIHWISGS
jgi:tRNA dimethylallyltransferase